MPIGTTSSTVVLYCMLTRPCSHAMLNVDRLCASLSYDARVGSENGHGETKNGPNANELSTTTEKKDSRSYAPYSRSYATVARGTKRFVRPE